MKIVHALGWYFPESIGGTETYVAGVTRRQRRRGYDVLVAAPSASRDNAAMESHDGVPVFRYPVPPRPTRDEAQSLTPARGAEAFNEWLSKVRPDILHVHSLVTGFGLHEMAAARTAGARIVVTMHLPSLGFLCARGNLMKWGEHACDGRVDLTTCAACALQKRGVPRPAALLLGTLPLSANALSWGGRLSTLLTMRGFIAGRRHQQHELYEMADAIVVLNRLAYEHLVADGAPVNKLQINRLGIEPAVSLHKRERFDSSKPLVVGYVGRFDIDKGVLDLAAAFSRLPSKSPLRLRFVGPMNEATLSIVTWLREVIGPDPRVTIEPAVPAAAVPALLSSLDVLCCPSSGFENGPTIALEALAAGTPVIGTTVGGLPEIVRHDVDGALVSPGDVPALATLLRRIGDQPAIVERWKSQTGSVRTLDRVADDYDALYEMLCGSVSIVAC